jgi:hypothetical protein
MNDAPLKSLIVLAVASLFVLALLCIAGALVMAGLVG